VHLRPGEVEVGGSRIQGQPGYMMKPCLKKKKKKDWWETNIASSLSLLNVSGRFMSLTGNLLNLSFSKISTTIAWGRRQVVALLSLSPHSGFLLHYPCGAGNEASGLPRFPY
jgi:hypothetical protein